MITAQYNTGQGEDGGFSETPPYAHAPTFT